MTIKKPKVNFVEVRLDQSFPDEMRLQFIAKVKQTSESDGNIIITATDDFGETKIEVENSEKVENLKVGDVIQIFAKNNNQKLQVLQLKKLEKFDFQTYKEVRSLGY